MRRGLLQEFSSTIALFAKFVDITAIIFGAGIAYYWRFSEIEFSTSYQIAVILAALLTAVIFPLFGIYRSWRGVSHITHIQTVTTAWLTVSLSIIVIAFLTKTSATFSRQWFIVWICSAWLLLIVFRLGTMQVLRMMRLKGFNHKRLLIIGNRNFSNEVVKNVSQSAWIGLDIVKIIDKDDIESNFNTNSDCGEKDLEQFVTQQKIDEVWLALPLREENIVHNILYELRHSTVGVRLVPDIRDFRLINHSINDIAGMPVLNLTDSPMHGFNRLVKSLEDKLIAAGILVVIAPLMAVIAIAVKVTSPGPIIFKQVRHGSDGKTIKVYKFRTMYQHLESEGILTQAKKNDERVTKIGAFLRCTSLDELPQFINVLQGRMSIVGPRPHAIVHNEYYKDLIDGYMQRHRVKPGITGWAQVNGFRGETEKLSKMRKRVEYDIYYIENWSLWFDLKIILLTIYKGFLNRNAY